MYRWELYLIYLIYGGRAPRQPQPRAGMIGVVASVAVKRREGGFLGPLE